MDHGRSILAGALLVVGFFFGSASADAASYKWHKQTVRYFVASKDANVIKTAQISAGLWNVLGLKIKLVRTKSSRKADIKIALKPQSYFATPFIMGTGQLPGGRRPSPLMLSRSLFYGGSDLNGPSQDGAVAVTVHELGHTLGLMHRNGCTIMRPSTGEACGGAGADGDRMLCGPTPSDYKTLKKKYGRKGKRKPRYYTCTGAFKRYDWFVPPPAVDSNIEWSLDGNTWSAAPGSVPTGSVIWLRHAIRAPRIVFTLYGQMSHSVRMDFTGGSWFMGGMPSTSSCIARTSASGAPTASTDCKSVSATPAGDGFEYEAELTGGDRYWLVARYTLEQEGAKYTFNGGARFYFLPNDRQFSDAGAVQISTPGYTP